MSQKTNNVKFFAQVGIVAITVGYMFLFLKGYNLSTEIKYQETVRDSLKVEADLLISYNESLKKEREELLAGIEQIKMNLDDTLMVKKTTEKLMKDFAIPNLNLNLNQNIKPNTNNSTSNNTNSNTENSTSTTTTTSTTNSSNDNETNNQQEINNNTNPITSPVEKNRKDSKSAEKYELLGFKYLLDKNVEGAIKAFVSAEKSYNGYHQVFEIARFLNNNKLKLKDPKSKNWERAYQEILTQYSWGMPEKAKIEMQSQVNIKQKKTGTIPIRR